MIDPGHHMTGPMKLELMTPHVETHGIYRFRQVPGKHQQLYLERHKKTVYSCQGRLVVRTQWDKVGKLGTEFFPKK